jgi:CHASE2 domain-containing sensor protein/class 3 adenylate cyclase
MVLATTLFVDVVGYSRQPTTWQARVQADIGNHLRECPAFVKAESSGQAMAIPSGDGFAAVFFGDPFDCLDAARELQKVSAGAEYMLRMAIHIGELQMVDADVAGHANISGASVNIAARLLEFAKPGQLLVTSNTREILLQRETNPPDFRFIGDFTAKHGLRLSTYRLVIPNLENGRNSLVSGWVERIALKELEKDGADLAAPELVRVRARRFLIGWLLTLAGLPVCAAIANVAAGTVAGIHLRQFAYETLLQVGAQPASQIPITIVDIRDLPHHPAFPEASDDNENIVDRAALQKVLDAVAKHKPRVIGLDIDLGPFKEGAALGDGELLRDCLRIRLETPVYVAVKRSLAYSNSSHLVFDPDNPEADYGDMVTHPGHAPLNPQDQQRSFDELSLPIEQADGKVLRQVVPSLPVKIAEAFSGIRVQPPERAAPQRSTPAQLHGPQFLVNYVVAPQLAQPSNTLRVRDQSDLVGKGEMFEGKMVIIGSSDERLDNWIIPGTNVRTSGVYWQAAVAYTRALAPLYLANGLTEFFLMLLAGLAILLPGLILAPRSLVAARVKPVSPMVPAITVTSVCGLILLSLMLVRFVNLLWLDVGLFIIVLLAFRAIRNPLITIADKLAGRFARE